MYIVIIKTKDNETSIDTFSALDAVAFLFAGTRSPGFLSALFCTPQGDLKITKKGIEKCSDH